MTINPAIRLVLLIGVMLGLFLTVISTTSTIASQNASLTVIRASISEQVLDRDSFRQNADRELNQELITKTETEQLIRIDQNAISKLQTNVRLQNPNSSTETQTIESTPIQTTDPNVQPSTSNPNSIIV